MNRLLLWMIFYPSMIFAAGPHPTQQKPHTAYVEEIGTSGVKFTMVPIPGGTFQLGSSQTEIGREFDEGPQRQVSLRPFWMGQHEVTWDEFRQFYTAQPLGNAVNNRTSLQERAADAVSKPSTSYIDETYNFGNFGNPVINVTHHAAMKYSEWLSKKTGKIYRLPTEVEWEYACRAGSKTAYSFGDEFNAVADRYCWSTRNAANDEFPKGFVHPVGRLKPNAWGLHDMHGNAAEWCLDMYSIKAYDEFPWKSPLITPRKLPTDGRFGHVVRGGTFNSTANELRSASRWVSKPSWMEQDPLIPQSIWWLAPRQKDRVWVGFRIVRAIEEELALQRLRSQVTRESK